MHSNREFLWRSCINFKRHDKLNLRVLQDRTPDFQMSWKSSHQYINILNVIGKINLLILFRWQIDHAEAWPWGATPRPRLGAATESTKLWQHRCSREELPHVWGQGQRPRGATPRPRSGAVAKRSYPTSEVRGSGREELQHILGHGRWPRGATPHVR